MSIGSRKLQKVKSLSRVRLFTTSWTIDYQAPPSMGFSRQEYWSGLPFPSPGDLPNPRIKPKSPALQGNALPSEPPGKPQEVTKAKAMAIGVAPWPQVTAGQEVQRIHHLQAFQWFVSTQVLVVNPSQGKMPCCLRWTLTDIHTMQLSFFKSLLITWSFFFSFIHPLN